MSYPHPWGGAIYFVLDSQYQFPPAGVRKPHAQVKIGSHGGLGNLLCAHNLTLNTPSMFQNLIEIRQAFFNFIRFTHAPNFSMTPILWASWSVYDKYSYKIGAFHDLTSVLLLLMLVYICQNDVFVHKVETHGRARINGLNQAIEYPSIHQDHTLCRALVLPKQCPGILGTILDIWHD